MMVYTTFIQSIFFQFKKQQGQATCPKYVGKSWKENLFLHFVFWATELQQ